MSDAFNRFAEKCALWFGSSTAFVLSVLLVLVWGAVGPAVGYSENWQLVINTVTTVVTFWMVFVIQNAQNRDSAAIQIKLNELIRATQNARDVLVSAEHLSVDELKNFQEEFRRLAEARLARVNDSGNGQPAAGMQSGAGAA